jgi:hypothetical protein
MPTSSRDKITAGARWAGSCPSRSCR